VAFSDIGNDKEMGFCTPFGLLYFRGHFEVIGAVAFLLGIKPYRAGENVDLQMSEIVLWGNKKKYCRSEGGDRKNLWSTLM